MDDPFDPFYFSLEYGGKVIKGRIFPLRFSRGSFPVAFTILLGTPGRFYAYIQLWGDEWITVNIVDTGLIQAIGQYIIIRYQ